MNPKTFYITILLVAMGCLVSAQGLKVEAGTCIKVESNTTLDISGGNLILESDATGDASLIDLGNVSYSGAGEARVKRYLTNGKWHLISAPVANIVSGQFEADYLQIHNETTNAWTDVGSMAYELIPARGYALWTTDANPTTELFAGLTNTGSQNFSFSHNGLGFNLVGNPYPSALDWDQVSIPANLGGAIWLFDPTVGTNGDYKYYIFNGGVANTTTSYIASGQGFFVKATGAGTLGFNNDVRAHSPQQFYKESSTGQMVLMKASGNQITTQTALRFITEATPQVDRLFDVNKIISDSPDVPVIYTLCEGQKMAINTLPSVSGHETVPLYFQAGISGTFTLSASQLETLDAHVPVFLEDVSESHFQNLRVNPEYSFSYSPQQAKEFNIHFKSCDVHNGAFSGPDFHSFLVNGTLTINYVGKQPFNGRALITLYNLSGQKLLATETRIQNTTLAFNATDAMYIVHIQYNSEIYSLKVINN